MSEIAVKRMMMPWLQIPIIFKLSKMGKRFTECLKILHGFTNRVIAERKGLMMGQTSSSGTFSSDEDTSIGIIYIQILITFGTFVTVMFYKL